MERKVLEGYGANETLIETYWSAEANGTEGPLSVLYKTVGPFHLYHLEMQHANKPFGPANSR